MVPTWVSAAAGGVGGIYLSHFFSTVRFRMQLRAELLRDASAYLSAFFVKVVAKEVRIKEDAEEVGAAYAESAIAGEELAARIGVMFYPQVESAFCNARNLIIPNSGTSPPTTKITKAYREAMHSALRAMTDALTVLGMLRGWAGQTWQRLRA